MKRDDASAGAVFAALADPTRRTVFALVGDRGPLSATELAAELPVTRQAIVKHLDALRAAGLVDSSKTGRDVRFVVRADALDDAAQWIDTVGRAWDRRLGALQQRAANRANQA